MIKVNNKEVTVYHFPDGTQCVKFPDILFYAVHDGIVVDWLYDSDEEIFTLASVMDWIGRNAGRNIEKYLMLPYLPNARMDRIKSVNDNFSLRVFAKFINSLGFDKVYVYNVHSNVSEALIENIVSQMPEIDIKNVIYEYKPDIVFFPDEGARKRYADLECVKESGLPVAFGIKKRDWKTGDILGLDVITDTDLSGKKAIIVDDICSAGGTFLRSAKKLKELGAVDVALYVSHCEDNIQNGDLLKTDIISKIYTTDSILHIEDPKIEVIHNFRN